ncbi:MAG TPA: ribonuclease toxin immunity protein CdiI [Paenibacillus sp.]|nr:ribonuclease toxin immunity protein CdiI [Paenibacillus sp.]
MTIESNKETELIRMYYTNLGDGYFLDALQNYTEGKGFGLGEIWCVFAGELKPWEEGYFGEDGVAYYFDYPVVEKDEVLVVNNDVFFRYLQQACSAFVERNPIHEAEVNELLVAIKNRYYLG